MILALHASRLTGRAVALTASTMTGYAAATYVIFLRMHAQTGFQSDYYADVAKGGGGLPIPAHLHLLWLRTFALEDMNQRFTPDFRYPNGIAHYVFEMNPGYTFLYGYLQQTLSLIFCTVNIALIVSYFAPLGLGPRGLTRAPAPVRSDLGRMWTDALRNSPMQWGLVLGAAASIGFSAAILGEAYGIVRQYWFGDLAWENGGPATNVVRPFYALLTPPDAVWLFLGCFLLAAGSHILAARSRLMQDPAMIARWCFSCGYPRVTQIGNTDAPQTSAPTLCPECGKPPGVKIQRFGKRHIKLAIAAIFILSVIAFFVVPRIVLSL